MERGVYADEKSHEEVESDENDMGSNTDMDRDILIQYKKEKEQTKSLTVNVVLGCRILNEKNMIPKET